MSPNLPWAEILEGGQVKSINALACNLEADGLIPRASVWPIMDEAIDFFTTGVIWI